MEGAFHSWVPVEDMQEGLVGLVVKGLEDLAEIAHRLMVMDAKDEVDLFHGTSLKS
jgi:hypothetical protein